MTETKPTTSTTTGGRDLTDHRALAWELSLRPRRCHHCNRDLGGWTPETAPPEHCDTCATTTGHLTRAADGTLTWEIEP